MRLWFISFFLILSLQAQAQTIPVKESLKVGIYTLEPLIGMAGGEPVGIVGAPFHRAALKDPNYNVHYSEYSFARFMLMLERHKLDMGLLVAKNKEREKKFNFSSIPLWTSRPGLVILKNSPLAHLKDLSELKDKNIGHTRGSIIPTELGKVPINWTFRSEEDYFPSALKSIELHRLDGFFVPTMAFANHKIEQLGGKGKYSVISLPIKGIKLYAIYPKKLTKEKVAHFEEMILKSGIADNQP